MFREKRVNFNKTALLFVMIIDIEKQCYLKFILILLRLNSIVYIKLHIESFKLSLF